VVALVYVEDGTVHYRRWMMWCDVVGDGWYIGLYCGWCCRGQLCSELWNVSDDTVEHGRWEMVVCVRGGLLLYCGWCCRGPWWTMILWMMLLWTMVDYYYTVDDAAVDHGGLLLYCGWCCRGVLLTVDYGGTYSRTREVFHCEIMATLLV
jgi:hypothetical protein